MKVDIMNNQVIYAILISSLLSYSMRIIPIFIGKKLDLGQGNIIKVFDYASCYIIGQIIYEVGFHNNTVIQLLHNFDRIYFINLFCIILSFLLCFFTKSIMKSLLSSLTLYALLILVF